MLVVAWRLLLAASCLLYVLIVCRCGRLFVVVRCVLFVAFVVRCLLFVVCSNV